MAIPFHEFVSIYNISQNIKAFNGNRHAPVAHCFSIKIVVQPKAKKAGDMYE